MRDKLILVVDLDGTLISTTTAKRIYQEAYFEAVKEFEKNGGRIPDELKNHSYENYRRLTKMYSDFNEISKMAYEKVLEKYLKSIREREENNARNLYILLKSEYNPDDIYILTANPCGRRIVNMLLPEIVSEKIIIVDGSDYINEKGKVLRELKSYGRVLYIADRDELDAEVARIAEVDYINVNLAIKSINYKNHI